MKKTILYCFPLMSLLLTGCSGSGDGEMEYIPFKSSSSGGWGLINKKGEVKYEGEFTNEITAANNGAFFVKNDKNEWLLYSTKEKMAKPIGEPYLEAGAFISDVAPVVRAGEHITLIKPDGSVAVTLDQKVEGKYIESCRNFYEGLAVISTSDGNGVINTAGEVVVKPSYKIITECSNGMMIALEGDDGLEKTNYKFIDREGKVTATLSAKDYKLCGNAINQNFEFSHGLIGVIEDGKDGTTRCGLMGPDGKWVLEPTSRIRYVTSISDDSFTYVDADDKSGIMDFKGEVIVKPEFKVLLYASDGKLLLAMDEDSDKTYFMNAKMENVTGSYFDNGSFSYGLPGAVFGKISENRYCMYDDKGKEIECKSNIYYVDCYDIYGDQIIHSKYVDVEHIVDVLGISDNGLLGLTLDMKPKSMVAQFKKAIEVLSADLNSGESMDESIGLSDDPSKYTYSRQFQYDLKPSSLIEGGMTLVADYGKNIADYSYTGDYYSGVYISECGFKDIKPKSVGCKLYFNNGKNVVNNLYTKLTEKVSKLGKIVFDEKGHFVVKGEKGNWNISKWEDGGISYASVYFTSIPADELVRDIKNKIETGSDFIDISEDTLEVVEGIDVYDSTLADYADYY